MSEILKLSTTSRKQVVDLTDKVEALIRKAKLQEGLCTLFLIHTTAALTTGEVGIVIGQNRVRRLRPKVMLVLDQDKQPLEITPIRDLISETAAPDGREIQIARTLEPGEYGLDPADYYL